MKQLQKQLEHEQEQISSLLSLVEFIPNYNRHYLIYTYRRMHKETPGYHKFITSVLNYRKISPYDHQNNTLLQDNQIPLGKFLLPFDVLLTTDDFLLLKEDVIMEWYVYFRYHEKKLARSYGRIKEKKNFRVDQLMSALFCSRSDIQERLQREPNAFLGIEKGIIFYENC